MALRALVAAARSRRLRVEEERAGVCPYVALPADVDDYDRHLSSNRRQQLRRGIRGLETMGEVDFRCSETLQEARRDLKRLGRLHRDHWRARGREGAFAGERFRRFHRRFIERTFPLGWPQIWTLSLDGRPAACLYNIRFRDRIAFYQSGVRTLKDRRIRPGMIAHYYAIREAIRSGATEYDFLMGDARYKRSLSNAERELVTLRLCRPCLKERVRRVSVRLARGLRRLKRAGRGEER
jgi:CelD/BcsL family acetyltransferase involved in cellulose biosynthesis